MKKTYVILLKNIKEKLNKWSDIPCFKIIKLNVGRSSPLTYRFNGTLTKILARLFLWARYKYFIKEQRAKNSQNIIKEQGEGITFRYSKYSMYSNLKWCGRGK